MSDDRKPICKIAQETGKVPLECLFECSRNCRQTHEQEFLDATLGFEDVEPDTRHYYDQIQFRVWPDGTVQAVEDGEPYAHMSDDYQLVWAMDEDLALSAAK
jgi:predicted 2-oxoglutarate/Fe(II)-dependent dioxygenase YbiX